MKKISVIGSGTMGSGIAQVFLQAGFEVVLSDTSKELAEKGVQRIENALTRVVQNQKLHREQKNEWLANLSATGTIDSCADSCLVVEAIYENADAKKTLYTLLEEVIGKRTLLATNTSSLSITALSSTLRHKERFVGMHFFNPAPVMELVEITEGMHTSEEATDQAVKVAEEIGKTPVKIQEEAGFIVNRLLIPMINEAVGVYAEHVASVVDIDSAMKLGANHPIGPLALGDMIGLDVCLAIMEVLHSEFGEDKYRPHPLLKKMVRGGMLGKKTGRGFYRYG